MTGGCKTSEKKKRRSRQKVLTLTVPTAAAPHSIASSNRAVSCSHNEAQLLSDWSLKPHPGGCGRVCKDTKRQLVFSQTRLLMVSTHQTYSRHSRSVPESTASTPSHITASRKSGC